MFYVIAIQYNRPADGTDRIEIRHNPILGNLDHQPVIDGWAGTTNDVASYARGAYNSEAEARAFVLREYGQMEEIDAPFGDPDVVATFQGSHHALAVEPEDWREAVAAENTVLGYCEWVDHQLEANQ